jgi:hypothetical protein
VRNYDWVLNAKARILGEKLNGPSQEFKDVIAKVRKFETSSH